MSSSDTKKRIIEKATDLFCEKGFDGVRTKEIAIAAGISEGTMFKYYSSKLAIYNAIFTDNFQIPDVNIVIDKFAYKDFKEDITLLTEEVIKFFYDNKQVFLMYSKEQKGFLPDRKITDLDNPVFVNLLPVFEIYHDQGVLNKDYMMQLRLYTKIVKGLCHQVFEEDLSFDALKKDVNDFLQIFFKGIL